MPPGAWRKSNCHFPLHKLPIDTNVSSLWVSFLAGEGIDAIHWSLVGGRRLVNPGRQIPRSSAHRGTWTQLKRVCRE